MDKNLARSQKTNHLYTKKSRITTVICFVILMAFVYYWLVAKANGSPAGRFGALVNVALFAALGIRFVPLWVRSWSRSKGMANYLGDAAIAEPIADSISANENAAAVIFNRNNKTGIKKRLVYVKVFCTFLLIDALIILFIYVLQVMSDNAVSFHEALHIWRSTDSAHYLDIAQDWYVNTGDWDRIVQLVFLPGYPLLVRLANMVIGDYLASSMVVSGLCFAGAGTMLYRLVRLDHSHMHAIQVLKYLCILPGAFFFAAPMSESLFLLLSVSCIYFLRKKDWFVACVLAGMAAFTRSLGLALFVPVLYEMIADHVETATQEPSNKAIYRATSGASHKTSDKAIYQAASEGTQKASDVKEHLLRNAVKYGNLIFILFGFGCYLFINYQVSGNPFQFLIYQKEHWYQSFGLFFNTVSYQIDYAWSSIQEQDFHTLMGLWLPNLIYIFSSLIIMLAAVKKLRPSYTAYFLIYYVIAIGATWLLSAPRYLLTLFPIAMALATVSRKRWLDTALTIGLTVLFVLYAYMFVNRWGVY